jgi:hypothetical protein
VLNNENAWGVRLVPGFWLILLGIISVVVTPLLATYLPQYGEALGALLGSGMTLLAMGLNELAKFYSSTTRLELRETMETMDNNTVRLYVEVYNKGNVTVKDAKAVVTVLEPPPSELSKYLVKNCLDNRNPCPLANLCRESRPYLVNRAFPRINGDLLPWSIPENPVPRPVATGMFRHPVAHTDFVHLTSISPKQRVRTIILDAIRVDQERWIIKIFSEYGVKGPGNDPTPRFPRACLWLDKTLRLRLRVTVYGENLRNPEDIEIIIDKRSVEQNIAKHME